MLASDTTTLHCKLLIFAGSAQTLGFAHSTLGHLDQSENVTAQQHLLSGSPLNRRVIVKALLEAVAALGGQDCNDRLV